jgi:hypothetical protein
MEKPLLQHRASTRQADITFDCCLSISNRVATRSQGSVPLLQVCRQTENIKISLDTFNRYVWPSQQCVAKGLNGHNKTPS